MIQTSLFDFSNKRGLRANTKVYDLFCGIGGFSLGAENAGHRVVLAVDNDGDLLDSHKRNHPNCSHVCCELPIHDIQFPQTGDWHLHGSPP